MDIVGMLQDSSQSASVFVLVTVDPPQLADQGIAVVGPVSLRWFPVDMGTVGRMDEFFEQIDKQDGQQGGDLGRDEVRELLRLLGALATDSQVALIFRHHDGDHSGTVSREEFEVVKAMAVAARDEADALKARLDALEAKQQGGVAAPLTGAES